MYPEISERTQVIVGSMNMGYISDTARNRTHNLLCPMREPIPLGHSDRLLGLLGFTPYRLLPSTPAKIILSRDLTKKLKKQKKTKDKKKTFGFEKYLVFCTPDSEQRPDPNFFWDTGLASVRSYNLYNNRTLIFKECCNFNVCFH